MRTRRRIRSRRIPIVRRRERRPSTFPPRRMWRKWPPRARRPARLRLVMMEPSVITLPRERAARARRSRGRKAQFRALVVRFRRQAEAQLAASSGAGFFGVTGVVIEVVVRILT